MEALPNTVCRVELANGHRVLAHLPGKSRRSNVRFAPGTKVILEMSPYDLSRGRIRLEAERILYEGSRISEKTL